MTSTCSTWRGGLGATTRGPTTSACGRRTATSTRWMTGASPNWRASRCLSNASTRSTWSTPTGRPQCTLSFKSSPVGSYRSSRLGGSGGRPGARGGSGRAGGRPAGGGQAGGRPRKAIRRGAGAGGRATAAGPSAIPCVWNRGYMSTKSQVHAPKNIIKIVPYPYSTLTSTLGVPHEPFDYRGSKASSMTRASSAFPEASAVIRWPAWRASIWDSRRWCCRLEPRGCWRAYPVAPPRRSWLRLQCVTHVAAPHGPVTAPPSHQEGDDAHRQPAASELEVHEEATVLQRACLSALEATLAAVSVSPLPLVGLPSALALELITQHLQNSCGRAVTDGVFGSFPKNVRSKRRRGCGDTSGSAGWVRLSITASFVGCTVRPRLAQSVSTWRRVAAAASVFDGDGPEGRLLNSSLVAWMIMHWRHIFLTTGWGTLYKTQRDSFIPSGSTGGAKTRALTRNASRCSFAGNTVTSKKALMISQLMRLSPS